MHTLLHIKLLSTEIALDLCPPPLTSGYPTGLIAIALRVLAATVAHLVILLLRDTAIGPDDLMIVDGV